MFCHAHHGFFISYKLNSHIVEKYSQFGFKKLNYHNQSVKKNLENKIFHIRRATVNFICLYSLYLENIIVLIINKKLNNYL